MVNHPPEIGAFEFAVLASLRAAQLMRGCVPRVEGSPKATTTAQREVAEGKVVKLDGTQTPPTDPTETV